MHLEVRPEYLQPWGCEVLSEEEIFSSLLGAHLSSPAKPTILRREFLRVCVICKLYRKRGLNDYLFKNHIVKVI